MLAPLVSSFEKAFADTSSSHETIGNRSRRAVDRTVLHNMHSSDSLLLQRLIETVFPRLLQMLQQCNQVIADMHPMHSSRCDDSPDASSPDRRRVEIHCTGNADLQHGESGMRQACDAVSTLLRSLVWQLHLSDHLMPDPVFHAWATEWAHILTKYDLALSSRNSDSSFDADLYQLSI